MASINVLRGRLYLLAKLPPRGGQDCPDASHWKQQRLALRLDDTPANRKVAQRRLTELERQLGRGEFDWGFWEEEKGGMRWREAIAALYRQKVVLGRTSESTWGVNYMGRLKQIDPGSLCTTKSIEEALMKYDRDSCSYKEMYYLLRHIAKLAAVPFPEVPMPTYRQAALVGVPSDEEIIATIERADPITGWYLGMMATYGLRPHEIEHAVLLDRDHLQVAEQSKTGFRTVVPCPAEWVERFGLREKRQRPSTRRTDSERNDQTAKFLSRRLKDLGVNWKPYALRHAYAGRLWRVGGSKLNIYTAARLMGHTTKVHETTYRAHVQPHMIAEDAERALGQR